MSLENLPEYGLLGAAGAASLELLKLYEYRGKLQASTYRRQVRSAAFWLVVLGMLVASGFIAWAVHAGRQGVLAWHVVITGIAARSVIRSAVAARVAHEPTALGVSDVAEPSLRRVFL
ncbi:MAG: hypothetical protein AAF533_00785 [Acidobacteriota bacterium]